MPVNEAVIIPTGGEIRDGTVLDTNSPAVIYSLLSVAPLCTVHRIPPLEDDQELIFRTVDSWIAKLVDIVILIGGSGGGHRHSSTLSEDYTHSALEGLLEEKSCREIWGKNGHLWCKLVCGRKNGTLVINLPGPQLEAKAAIEAFCSVYLKAPDDLAEINEAMMRAVIAQYPDNKTKVFPLIRQPR